MLTADQSPIIASVTNCNGFNTNISYFFLISYIEHVTNDLIRLSKANGSFTCKSVGDL